MRMDQGLYLLTVRVPPVLFRRGVGDGELLREFSSDTSLWFWFMSLATSSDRAFNSTAAAKLALWRKNYHPLAYDFLVPNYLSAKSILLLLVQLFDHECLVVKYTINVNLYP